MNMEKFAMLSLFLLFVALNSQSISSSAEGGKLATSAASYQCMPCGRDCDNDTYDKPGKCPHCQMELVEKSTVHFKTIEPSLLCQYVADHPNVVLLDVRTKQEFEGKADPNYGTLKNAINIPVQELEKNISMLAPYKEKEIIVYCSHSHRSPQACYILTQNGFSNVTNMNGGMSVMKDKSCMR
jgi:rhodanese-related sulfurtransferase/DNA-directed RNA polymerase subunit RPC12/RpoP